MTKQPRHKIEQWHDLARHFTKVTVGDMLRFFYSEGRLQELDERIPVVFPEDTAKRAWKKVLRALAVLAWQFPERLYWRIIRTKVARYYQDPAKIRWPFPAPELLPHEDPRINHYAQLVDMFASEYGWSEKEVLKLKFSAINEYILAAEYRKVRVRADLANAVNLSEESSEIIAAYPKRHHDLTPEERELINKRRYEERKGQYV